MFEKSLADLIRGIRANKKGEEAYIATCLGEISTEIKSNDIDIKAVALQKLTYVCTKYIFKTTNYIKYIYIYVFFFFLIKKIKYIYN